MAKRKDKLKHSVKVGGKWYRLKTAKPFFPELTGEELKATEPQVRNLAMGSAVMLIEKILAGDAQGFPKTVRVSDLTNIPKGFRGRVERRPFKHERLNEEYLAQKVREGLDPRPLIATGFYIEHIETVEDRTPEGRLWVVRVPDIIHEPSGVPLKALVGWLEFGTEEAEHHPATPARPHWRPVAVMVRQKWKRLPKDVRAAALRNVLREMR